MEKAQSIPVYDSALQGSPALDELREVIRYRHLVIQMARRDILTRYKRSALGVAWTMLNPLGTMLILTIAFSRAFGTTEGYAAYLLSGLVAWTFFSQTTNASISHLVWGGGLMNRIYLPRTVFAISAIATGLVNLFLSIFPIMVVMLVTGVTIRWTLIFLPVSMLLLACFSLGVGLLVSAIAVYFSDVAEMYQIVLTAWMYLTPIIYPESILPETYRIWITRLNPMYHLVRLFRMPIYEGQLPGIVEFLVVVFISVAMLVISWFIFTKKADEFAYRI